MIVYDGSIASGLDSKKSRYDSVTDLSSIRVDYPNARADNKTKNNAFYGVGNGLYNLKPRADITSSFDSGNYSQKNSYISPSDLKFNYYDIKNNPSAQKYDPQKSTFHAFDQPHWRKNGPSPKVKSIFNTNTSIKKLKDSSIQYKPKNNEKKFKQFSPADSYYQLNRKPNNLPKGLNEISSKNLYDSSKFATNNAVLSIKSPIPISPADSYQVPGYVNLDNLPFEIGSIISDDDSSTDYKLVNVLGEGTYAVVYLARNLSDNKNYALKCLSRHNLTKSQKDMQIEEINLHKISSNVPSVVKLYHHFSYNSWLFLVMERVTGTDLYDFIMQHPNFGSSERKDHQFLEALRLFEQMLEVVSHIHSLKIYHRDLKPENFIVTPNGDLKLTDFGLATKETYSKNFECGSKPYMSYENRNGGLDIPDKTIYGNVDEYSPRLSDIWALGILLLNLLFGESPWQDPSTDSCFRFCDFLRDGSRYLCSQFPRLPKEMADFLVSNVFCPEEKRCSVLELKLWVKGLQSSASLSTASAIHKAPKNIPSRKTLRSTYNQNFISNNKSKYSNKPYDDSRKSIHTNSSEETLSVDVIPNPSQKSSDSVYSTMSSSVPAHVFSQFISATKTAAVLQAMPRDCNGAAAKTAAFALRSNQHKPDNQQLNCKNDSPVNSNFYQKNQPHFAQQISSSYIPKAGKGFFIPPKTTNNCDENTYTNSFSSSIKYDKNNKNSSKTNDFSQRFSTSGNTAKSDKFNSYYNSSHIRNLSNDRKFSQKSSFGASDARLSDKVFNSDSTRYGGSSLNPLKYNPLTNASEVSAQYNQSKSFKQLNSNSTSSSLRRKSWRPSHSPLKETHGIYTSGLSWADDFEEDDDTKITNQFSLSEYTKVSPQIDSISLSQLDLNSNDDSYNSDIFEME
ncbi:Negative regulator of sexual conjugation and meiosis [Smittium culicis]|uniref:non-specific serine/threonine protein kinase n=1 Tax=Smittium culicis TaxID=133412 RepID=A0A1R1WZ06_9FUNG|nr:Negative regulator of sexual conjugation and meiosis [Smittium culicis]OMJ07823.1 Negative regulator of sexual conjugation and meiosis [Smittium culicis]